MDYLKLNNKKIKKKKNQFSPNEINLLKKCTTKNKLNKILQKNLSQKWKKLIKFYITDCFIFDLYTRKLENKIKLLENREIFYNIIDNPDLLKIDCHFDNNMIKNFCTGLSNYLKIHFLKMKAVLDKREKMQMDSVLEIKEKIILF